MQSLLICSVVFVTILMVHGDDHPIVPIPTECPKKDSLNYTVHIAHEKSCSRFYKCQAGKKIPKEGLLCPKMKNGGRLYFNPTLQVCDWPYNVECRSPKKPENDQPKNEQPEDEQPEDDQPEDEQPEDEQPEDEQPEDEKFEDEQLDNEPLEDDNELLDDDLPKDSILCRLLMN